MCVIDNIDLSTVECYLGKNTNIYERFQNICLCDNYTTRVSFKCAQLLHRLNYNNIILTKPNVETVINFVVQNCCFDLFWCYFILCNK